MSFNKDQLRTEAIEEGRQFPDATYHPMKTNGADPSCSGRVAPLKQTLDDRLGILDTGTWQLLLREWRYDFALLFEQVGQWMAHVDADFGKKPSP